MPWHGLLGLFFIGFVCHAMSAVQSSALVPTWLNKTSTLLVEIRLNTTWLPDFYDAFVSPTGDIYLQAADIFLAAEATVDNPSANVLSISLESRGESLTLDLKAQTLSINGKTRPATADDAFVLDGRMFVAEALMVSAFGLTFTYD
ncbi:MAG: hypothetical protein HQ446_10490, partial [Polaromonas sp.]|nr:hypothetical protein [Polaromonas sp.]